MQGKVLALWLKKLQDEFVNRMSAIDAEVAAVSEDDETGAEQAAGNPTTSPRFEDSRRELSVSLSGDGQYMMTGALQSDDDREA